MVLSPSCYSLNVAIAYSPKQSPESLPGPGREQVLKGALPAPRLQLCLPLLTLPTHHSMLVARKVSLCHEGLGSVASHVLFIPPRPTEDR